MSTQQSFLPQDNTNFTQMAAWGSIVSAFMTTAGWTRQNDTGQAVWAVTTLTFTQVAVSGGSSVYSYSGYTGPTPRVGMSIVITGFATGGNNVTATLTAVSGGASGTVTVTTSTQVNETHAGSGVTTLSTLPGTSAYIYEMWCPADALQTGATAYYAKLEYGNGTTSSGVGTPQMRVTLGMGTNGAGTLTGLTTAATVCPVNGAGVATTVWECNFSGDTDRISIMLWRNGSSANLCIWGIERTKDTTGANSSDGVTIFSAAGTAAGTTRQQTILFGVSAGNQYSRWLEVPRFISASAVGSDVFGNSVPISPLFPCYGKIGNPVTIFCTISAGDIVEGTIGSCTLYGGTRTYLFTKAGQVSGTPIVASTAIGMRWD